MKKIVLFISIMVFSQKIYAEGPLEIGPTAETVIPIFLGAGVKAVVQEKYEVSLQYGFTPEPYYKTIAKVAAQLGGNSSYEDVVIAGFQNNSALKLNLQYDFENSKAGWHMGSSLMRLKSSGKADIDAVLAAATGRNYSNLKTLLVAAGKDTKVDMDGELIIAEVFGGYTYPINSNFIANFNLGIAKVITSDVKLKTGLPAFESSTNGSALMRSSEGDLEDILNEYGISPTLSANISYLF